MGPVRARAHAVAIAFGLASVLLIAGCGSQSDPSGATSAGKGQASRKTEVKGGDPDMVGAFGGIRGQPGLVDLKFKVTRRPAVGEPVEIELELIPNVELERLFGRFQAGEGLQIVSGSETEHFEHPAKGVPVPHKLSVTAKADGIFYVTAILLADSDKESVARNFSFPLIAGQGLSEASAPEASAANVAPPNPTSAQP
jgi:hypothetical protein